jgi:two-component system response regulator GlrR
VRQLLNVVEQCVALSTSPVVPATLVQQALRDEATLLPSLDEARRAFEYDYLVRLLKATGGNVTQAARMAQRNRTEFYKLLQRHNLVPALFKSEKI